MLKNPRSEESIMYEARARVMWGESEKDVVEWLMSQGIDDNRIDELMNNRIDELMNACRKERDMEIRKKGIAALLLGGGIVAVCVFVFFSGIFSAYLMVALFFGLYKVIDGLFLLLNGGKIRGSVSDIGESGV
jgi:hypothetical protein